MRKKIVKNWNYIVNCKYYSSYHKVYPFDIQYFQYYSEKQRIRNYRWDNYHEKHGFVSHLLE